jgi:hypothetical protein
VEFDPRPGAPGEHFGQRVEHDAQVAVKCELRVAALSETIAKACRHLEARCAAANDETSMYAGTLGSRIAHVLISTNRFGIAFACANGQAIVLRPH